MPQPLAFGDLDLMADIMRQEGPDPARRWAAYHGRYLGLPTWFDRSLDPDGGAYRDQQLRLWQAISGVAADYDPARDEQAPEVSGFDAFRFPAFYARRSPGAVTEAGDHLIALGNLVKLSGLRPGDRVIEYGAGFGQIALTLARLGVQVDAVDINRQFNAAVRTQAEIYGVPLRAIHGGFGDNPRPGTRYDAVLFYESFHHCQDAAALIAKLRELVKPGGAVLMAGEPIVPPCDNVPYPWGMRLDAETVAVVRWRHWFEIGFQEDYLVRAFISGGFVWSKHPCALTQYGEVHVFRPRPARIRLTEYAIPAADGAGWLDREPAGRWTTARAVLPLDATPGHTHLRIALGNYHAEPVACHLGCGPVGVPLRLEPIQAVVVTLPCAPGTRTVSFDSDARPDPASGRVLGVFVTWFEYASLGDTGIQVEPLPGGADRRA